MEGCFTIPPDFFPLTPSSVRWFLCGDETLPTTGLELSVEFKEAGSAALAAPPPPPPPVRDRWLRSVVRGRL